MVASERVVRNRDAVLIAAIYKVPVGARVDPLALLGEQRLSEEQQRGVARRDLTQTIIFRRLAFGDFISGRTKIIGS